MIKNKLKTKSFNDGLVKIYSVANTAPPGDTPNETLTLKCKLRYGEQKVGITRYYHALQSNIRISKLLRCPFHPDLDTEHIAVPNDGLQYNIVQIQTAEDEVNDVAVLSLARTVTDYEIE